MLRPPPLLSTYAAIVIADYVTLMPLMLAADAIIIAMSMLFTHHAADA